MSPEFRLPEQNAIAADARRLVEAGADQQLVLGVLRKGGLSKIDSIKVLSEVAGIPLLQAKDVVYQSRAWRDAFPKDTEFHALLAAAMRDLKEDENG